MKLFIKSINQKNRTLEYYQCFYNFIESEKIKYLTFFETLN